MKTTTIETRPARPPFQAGVAYIVVQPFSLGVDEAGRFEVGRRISWGEFSLVRMRRLRRRSRIGPEGDPWTEWMLAQARGASAPAPGPMKTEPAPAETAQGTRRRGRSG